MRGSLGWQVGEVFKELKAFGQSKFEFKKEFYKNSEDKSMQNFGKESGIYSYKTYDKYSAIATDLLHFAKNNFGIKDILKLNSEVVDSYLDSKLHNDLAKKTLSGYAGAITKLETALNVYSTSHGLNQTYKFDTASFREQSNNLSYHHVNRAYQNPEAIINALSGKYQLAIKLQYEGGMRVGEVGKLKAENLKDDNTISVRGKGGKSLTYKVSAETYRALSQTLSNGQYFFIRSEGNRYREALNKASKETGQIYQGSHGFRYNAAQDNMLEKLSIGASLNEAKQNTSEMLGHNRLSITDHYTKF
ncbi:MAG: tyrosine-type recombinase/integrase [bacterium]